MSNFIQRCYLWLLFGFWAWEKGFWEQNKQLNNGHIYKKFWPCFTHFAWKIPLLQQVLWISRLLESTRKCYNWELFCFSALKPLILDTSSSATKTFSKMSTWYKCTSQNSRVELGFPFRTILKNSCMSAICRIFVGFVCFGKILVS